MPNPFCKTLCLVMGNLLANTVFSQPLKLVLPIGHTSYVKSAAISPDARRVITVGEDERLLMWEIKTGIMITEMKSRNKYPDQVVFNRSGDRVLETPGISGSGNAISLWNTNGDLIAELAHDDNIKFAQFSEDGRLIVTASFDQKTNIWNAATGGLVKTLQGEFGILFAAHFSSDATKIITTAARQAFVWDVATGALLLTLQGHSDRLVDAIFSKDGKKILTIATDKTARLWDAATGNLLHSLQTNGPLSNAEFNADGTFVITQHSEKDNGISLWNTSTGELVANLTPTNETTRFTRVSPNGQLILTASDDEKVRLYELATGKKIFDCKSLYGGVSDAVFSPDNKKIIVSAHSGKSNIYDAITGDILFAIPEPAGAQDIEMSKDGRFFILSGSDNIAYTWDLENYRLISRLLGHTTSVKSFQYSADNKKIVTSAQVPGVFKIWDPAKAVLLANKVYDGANMKELVFSPSWNIIVKKYKDHRVEVWDVPAEKLSAVLDKQFTAYLTRIAISPDEKKIITSDVNNRLRIWNAVNGVMEKELPSIHTTTISNICISSDGSRLVTQDIDQVIVIWNLIAGNSIAVIKKASNKFIDAIQLAAADQWLITMSSDKTAKLWSVQTGELLFTASGHKGNISQVEISPDKQRMLTRCIYDDVVKIWDLKNKKLLADLKGHKGDVWKMNISPDWKYLATTAMLDSKIFIWDIEKGALVYTLPGHQLRTLEVQFIENGKQILTRGNDAAVKIWDVASGNLLRQFGNGKSRITSMDYDAIAGKVLTGGMDGKLQLWNAASGSLIADIIGHSNMVNQVKFGLLRNTFISASEDNTLKTWDASSGALVNTFFAVDNSDYFTQVQGGYFQSSPGAAKQLHYTTSDMRMVSFEQLDVKYNRPDKVLRAMGNADTLLMSSYRKAYEKRIKKLGIDTLSFRDGVSIPVADFTDRNQVAFEQTNQRLQLRVNANDSVFQLKKLNVWVNEIPLFGAAGMSIGHQQKSKLDTTVTILLSQGENRIETSVSNVNGVESFRSPLTVKYDPPQKEKESIYFAGIGINHFENNKYDLKWSVKDIRDLAIKLKDKYGDALEIDTLFNEQVTTGNVKALRKKLKQTSVNDKVILSYSGHGLLSKKLDYYLSTYAVNFENPEQNGLPYEELENLLDSIPARKKLLLIDACHSGEVDKEEGIAISNSADSLGLSKGVIIKNNHQPQVGLKNSFELMQSLFVNVGKSTGATIISAAAGNQFALERGDLKNGVFTFSILEAMSKHTSLKISELKKIVGERVEQLTNGLQKPTSRNETIAVDWEVW